ncbi:MAG: hypothetical protein A2029_09535 [Chloroflexi bacterium RBG_19FT_COMBO_47_9]|nr:MAG: hypothetical protein A2029_09535 [Chloroflexi bacterium RBG_19FT_COMBO_47_9]
MKLWDLTLPHEVLTLTHSSGFIYGVAFSPDGKWLATAGQDQTTIIWEIPSGKKIKVLQGHTDTVNTTTFSPDGVLLAIGNADGTVMVWDTHTWQVLHTLSGFGDDRSTVPYILGVYSIKFSPLCHTESTSSSTCPLAGVGMDGHLIVWDVLTGQPMITYQDPQAGLMSVAFSPDGTLLVVGNASVGGGDSWATILDATTGNVVHALPSANAWTWGVAFSPDGDQLATINFYGDGKVWDVESGEPLVSLNGIQDGGFSITYNPSGTLLAAGSNGYVSLIDAKSGLLLFPLLGHQSLVARTAFSPDGTYLATAGFDGTARVYVVPAEDLLSLAKSRLTRSLTLEECQKYLHQATCP